MDSWFDTYAVVLSEGTGAHDRHPLVAFDRALHGKTTEGFRGAGIADCNLIEVSSILPPGVRVCRMRSDAEPVKAQGLMVPTVYSRADTCGQAQITAAVGVGVPADRSRAGIIFEAHGGSRDATVADLDDMIQVGMKDRAVDDWTIHRAVATSLPDDGPHGLHRCAVAALCFLDRQLWALFQPLTEPVE